MKKVILVASNADLLNPHKYRVQWMIFRNVVMRAPKMSRRKVLDEISIAFANCQHLNIRHSNGMPYETPYIDDIFSHDDEMRWLSYYLESNKSGSCPRRVSRKPERLRVLNLFIKIRYPRFIHHLEK